MVVRADFLQLRNNLNSSEIKNKSEAIIANFKHTIDIDAFDNILCFYPTNNEVDFLNYYQELLDNGKSLFFPKTIGTNMDFYSIFDIENDFSLGNYKIMEPIDGVMPDLTKKTLVITPGLVFDKSLNRIGYGKGFYDRFFSEYPNVTKIGICYDFQIIDNVYPKDHDVPLDYVISDACILIRRE